MRVIQRAIQWVNKPLVGRIALVIAALLGSDGMLWKAAENAVDQVSFHALICQGDEIRTSFEVDIQILCLHLSKLAASGLGKVDEKVKLGLFQN